MTNHDDILDGCLEELLGGTNPPDLTARILKACDASKDILDAPLEEVLGGITPPDVVEQVIQARSSAAEAGADLNVPPVRNSAPVVAPAAAKVSANARSHAAWPRALASIAMGLALLVCGGLIAWQAWQATTPGGTSAEIVQEDEIFGPRPAAEEPELRDLVVQPVEEPRTTTPLPVESVPIPEPVVKHPLQSRHPDRIARRSTGANRREEVVSAADDLARQSDGEVVRTINTAIRQRWNEANATPADLIDEKEWCNRVYEKIIGRQAEHYELATFSADNSADKRAKLVERLLRDEWYTEDFSAHWADVWSDILLATAVRRANRDGLAQFLRRAFAEGQPMDGIAARLLTATGSGTQEHAGSRDDHKYEGSVNYLLAYADRQGKHVLASAHVSRTFLGRAMECNQCHHAGSWRGYKQQTFWEFNAFFRQMKVERGTSLVNVNFAGEGGSAAEAELYYELANGVLKAAYPVFVDEQVAGFDTVGRSGDLKDVNRRELLADMVIKSRLFRRAMVNRFWGEVFGAGFTTPVDDLGPHNPASHPQLLAELGDQFAAHDYDVRSLIKWMVLSEPFSLAPEAESPERGIGTQELFASFPVILRQQEPLESVLIAAANLHAAHRQFPLGTATSARVAPTAPGAPPADISEVDRVLSATRSEVHRTSDKSLFGQIILGSELSWEQKIQHMFFATVHRPPTKRELATIGQLISEIAAEGTNARAADDALRYIWWALSNSHDAR